MILFFDTETDGLTQNSLPPDHPRQPNLVQLGCVLTDNLGRELAVAELIVEPDGYKIPDGAAGVHGITTDKAHACGVPLVTALSVFCKLRQKASEIAAFNLPFDDLVLRTAFHRAKRQPSHPGPMKRTCVMMQSTNIINLPPTAKMLAAGFDKPKNPNLSEAYRFFFNEELQGAHGALVDARAAARVYFELQRLHEAG